MPLGRRYWTLWGSSALGNLGDGIFQLALGLLAVELTRSPALVAGVALAARLPWLFLALPAGAIADRVDRKQTMVLATIARVGLLGALTLVYATDVASIGWLYVVALGLGVAEVFFDTSSQTMMPAVVDKDDLSTANGRLFAVEMVMNQFVGPPLGGLLVAISAVAALASSSVIYGAAAVLLLLLRGVYRTRRTTPPAGMRTDIAEGIRYLWRHRVLRTLALLLGSMNLLASAQMAVYVLYATSSTYGLGLSDEGVGLLFAVTAAGALAGSLITGRVESRLGRTTVLTLSVVLLGVQLLVPGLTRNVVIVAAAGLLTAGVTMWNVVTVSLRQRIIPDHLLGRVNSAYRLLGWGSMPVGAAIGGLIGEAFGVRAVFLVTGALSLLMVIPLRAVITDKVIASAEAVDASVRADA
jgi:MFS family permease